MTLSDDECECRIVGYCEPLISSRMLKFIQDDIRLKQAMNDHFEKIEYEMKVLQMQLEMERLWFSEHPILSIFWNPYS